MTNDRLGFHFDLDHATDEWWYWVKELVLKKSAPRVLDLRSYWTMVDEALALTSWNLIRVVKLVFLIPPTTVECERVFSWKRWSHDVLCQSRSVDTLANLCQIYFEMRVHGRDHLTDPDVLSILQRLGTPPRLRTKDRGQHHKPKTAAVKQPKWDQAQPVPNAAAPSDPPPLPAGLLDDDHSEDSETSASDSDPEEPESEQEPVDDDTVLQREVDEAQLKWALLSLEAEDSHLGPASKRSKAANPLCQHCHLPAHLHPRATSVAPCSKCATMTHCVWCTHPPPNETVCLACLL